MSRIPPMLYYQKENRELLDVRADKQKIGLPSTEDNQIRLKLASIFEFDASLGEFFDLAVVLKFDFTVYYELAASNI
ncbi:hypothetical protein CVT26_001809 [Gymnopilus dilepis]|uniref:Uncharacterized protein n=1 Tax=Gymnopilus dilepis TaxID=231916 RepID=A0A409Y494_9AGAR|nr:hypothetical protein CVT26_001809 [Gymnopilus dilepis]